MEVQKDQTHPEVAPPANDNTPAAPLVAVKQDENLPDPEMPHHDNKSTIAMPEEPPKAPEASKAPVVQPIDDSNDEVKPSKGTEAAPAPPFPSDDAITEKLQEVLKEVNLQVTTEKMLRRQLQSHFGVDLSEKKALIRAQIESYLETQQPEVAAEEKSEEHIDTEGEESDDDNGKKKRSRGQKETGMHHFGAILSEHMSNFLGMERCPRTQVVKKLWEYIKANDLQDPKDRRRIILDDKLKTIFPGKSVNMFGMQKHLSKHVFTDDTIDDDDDDEEEEDEKPSKKKSKSSTPTTKSKPKSTSSTKKDKDGPAKVTGFTKPVKLSPELAAFMGSPTASRPEITKKLWAYVKESQLQDPSNKQFILADETLKNLTGEERFQGFTFSKLIKGHIHGYA